MKVLLLNSWYFPIQIIPWTAAVTMKYKNIIEVVSEYSEEVCSPSVRWKMPAVIRLKKQVRSRKNKIKYSSRNIYLRDNHSCQYCGIRFPESQLSVDHVIPKKHGGTKCWTNIVTSCKTCNLRKGSLSCDEAGMFPINIPTRPKSLPVVAPYVEKKEIPVEWLPYLTEFA
jgi:5-methylcytosine-specific restriction endonuclease McrA